MNENNLKRLQQCQLTLALAVKDICEKHSIPYFLIAGTLLGAVRHQGFIPWDDDLDIGMLREDYDRFVEVAKLELSEKYFLQTYFSDPHMPLAYAKLRMNNTVVIEQGASNCAWHKGIFIDIFPFDGVPSNVALRALHKWALLLCSRSLMVKCGFSPVSANDSLAKRVFYFLLIYPTARMVTGNRLVRGGDHLMRLFSGQRARAIGALGGSYGYDREVMESAWFSESCELAFDSTLFRCPKMLDAYLRNLYGDYMKLPPVEQRGNRHSIIDIDFGED